MQIAIGLPIGYQAGAGGGEAEEYRLNDTFTTDRAAGAVDGTLAEPGPGVRSVVDTESKLTITSSALAFSGGKAVPAFGNPAIWYGPYVRKPGRLVIFTVTPAATNTLFMVGWGNNSVAINNAAALRFRNAGDITADETGVGPSLGTYAATTYSVAILLRASGAITLIKGGIYTNWTLLFIRRNESTALLYPSIQSSNAVITIDDLYVPALKWLPSPLVSDGFSTWGTSDGLGHAEGIAGGLGSGGSGDAWTAVVGTWGASGGVAAASALSGGRAIATADSGKADLIATVNCTFSSGTMSLIVRWVDEANHVQVRLTPTNCQLVKVVAGVSTTVSDIAYTYVAGAPLRLICSGDKFRRFYNNAAIGAEFTIADAAIQSATVVGLRTDNTGNTFDDLTAFARGTGGEYDAVLDAI